MDPEDRVLTAARNGPEPSLPYNDDLTGKATTILNKEIERKKGLLKQSHSKHDGAEFKKIIRSCQYHVELNTAVSDYYKTKLAPIRREVTKWGDKTVQLAVIKLVKVMWTAHSLPMHISYFKLYNKWSNTTLKTKEAEEEKTAAKEAKAAAKAAAKAPKTGKSKRTIEEVEDVEDANAEQPSKHARSGKLPAKKVSKVAKTAPQPPKRTKSGPTAASRTKPNITKKEQTKTPARIGSDGFSLGLGACRLGDAEEQLAQGTIISLTPKFLGTNHVGDKISLPWNDGVLCRFTCPLQGRGAETLIGSVFSVCTLHVIVFVNLLLPCCCRLLVDY